jgi:hypothetical protein
MTRGGAAHMKASLLLDQLAVARELVGEAAVERALHRVDAATREELVGLLPVSTVSLTTVDAIHDAVAAEVGEDPAVWHRRVIRQGTERTFATVWRFFLRLTTLEAIAKRVATVFSKTFDRGAMTASTAGPGLVRMELTGWPDVGVRQLVAVEVATESVMHLSGRKHTTVRWTRTPDGAVFEVNTTPDAAGGAR